jgi:hypothetical protein
MGRFFMSFKLYFSMILVALSVGLQLHASQTAQEIEQKTHALQIAGQKRVNPALNQKLIDAVRKRDMNTVEELFSANAEEIPDVNARGNKYALTPVQTAVRDGNVDMVKKLLALGADINLEAVGLNKVTAMGIAIYNAHDREKYGHIIKMLIAAGADVNKKSAGGTTPLMEVIKYPYLVEIFLEAGANPLSRDINGQTAREIAKEAMKKFKDSQVLRQIATVIKMLDEAEKKIQNTYMAKRMDLPEKALNAGFAQTEQKSALPEEAVARVHEYLGVAQVPGYRIPQAPYLSPDTKFAPQR